MNSGTPINFVLLLVAASVILLVVGLALRRRGQLRTRGAAVAWSILTILPLFGAGAAMYTHHQVEIAQGQENAQQTPSSGQSRVNGRWLVRAGAIAPHV